MKKTLFLAFAAVFGTTICAAQTHDVSRDFSLASNPNGVWSHGWKGALNGSFTLLTASGQQRAENGVLVDVWSLTPNTAPAVYHNSTTNTATSDGGQGVYPPGTTWFYAGQNGAPQNYGVIRLTVPADAAGTYRLESAVRPHLNGPPGNDNDYYVFHNATQLHAQNVPLSGSGGYSNTVALNAGDTIDFVVGRGTDGLNSGLKIEAALTRTSALTLVVPRINENLDGSATDGGGSGALNETIRIQTVYGASQFPSGSLRITEIRMRPSAVWGSAFTSTIPDLQINMSTTAAQANNLSATFAENVGPNNTVVFQGPITLSSRFVGPARGPKEFDIIIPLQTPFTYDSTAGNLLVEVRNPRATSVTHVDAGGALNDDCSRAYAYSVTATTASTRDKAAEVLQLVYTAQPGTAPTITTHPQTQSVTAGSDVTFSVTANGTPPLAYQWIFNGSNISGATASSLTISNAQAANAGDYSVRVSNSAGFVISSNAVLTVNPGVAGEYDVSRDFSLASNPNGVWSYGWSSTIGGTFSLLTSRQTLPAQNGVPHQIWSLTPSTAPAVKHNATTNTATSDGPYGVYPPGTTWFTAGENGAPHNFGIIRFTTPAGGGGDYRIAATVRPYLDGPPSNDSDFYVLRNGVQLHGENVPPNATRGYSNIVTLAAGDVVDFLCGRGLDGLNQGLKIQASLNAVSPPPTGPTFDVGEDFSLVSNPNGAWSYGWKGALDGSFNLLTAAGQQRAENGVLVDVWSLTPTTAPAVYHNGTTNTATSDGGQGVYPPGTTWFYAGQNGAPQNYGVIRLTVPADAAGTYRLESAVRPHLNGPPGNDNDYYVFHNATQLHSQNVPLSGSGGYSNTVALHAGDTIDFVVGRGTDGLNSGLKIQAALTRTSSTPPPPQEPHIVSQPTNQTATAGSTVTFNVRATGTAPLSYQWRFNGDNIAGANSSSLTLNDVDFLDAGAYSVVVSNAAGSVTSTDATLTVRSADPEPTYDVSRDFSPSSNPTGPWSYGWKGSLDGAFTLLPVARRVSAENGVPVDYWALTANTAPAVYHNGSSQTATSDGGRGVFPPGTTWFYAGENGAPQNFGVIRFTVPANAAGDYRISAAVQPYINGPPANDNDFYVLLNDRQLHSQNVPLGGSSAYSSVLTLREGDVVDFVVGRGLDGINSGLKIDLTISTCAAQPNGLIGWWPLDGSGEDIIGNNSATLVGNPAFGPGKVGEAMLADGVDDEARMTASSTLDLGTAGGLSIEAWINPTDVTVQHPIVEWNNHQIAGAHFWISVGGAVGTGPGSLYANLIDVNNNSHIISTAPGLITTGAWQHVAVTYDKASGEAALYLNGTLAAQRNLGTFIAQTTYDLFFGRRIALPGYEAWFAGGMDEISLYNRALSAAEVAGIYNASGAGKCPPNAPPTAKAVVSPVVDLSPKLTNLLVLSVNGTAATVTLDGSQSSDPEGAALTYTWYANGSTTPIATGVHANVSLALGSHAITLVVDDGLHTGSDTVEVEVITIEDMLNILVVLVDEAGLPRKNTRPLINTLKQAQQAAAGERARVAIIRLEQFQQKVAAQVTSINAECAEALINAAQQVIDALSAP